MIKVTGYRLNQPTFKAETAEVKKDSPKEELKNEQKVSEGMSVEKKVGLGAALVALAAVGIYMAKGKKAPNKGVDELSGLAKKGADDLNKGAEDVVDEFIDLTKKGADDMNKGAEEIVEEINIPEYGYPPNIGKPSFKEKLSNIKNSIGETCSSAVDWLKGIGKAKKNKGLSEITAKKD